MTQTEQLTSKEHSEKRSRVSRFVSKIVALRNRGSVVYEDASLDEILDGPRPTQEETPVPAIELPAVSKVTASGLPSRSLNPAVEKPIDSAFAPAGTTQTESIKTEASNVISIVDRTPQQMINHMNFQKDRMAKVLDLAAKREAKEADPFTRTIDVPSTDPTPEAVIARSDSDAFMEAKRARDAVFNADPLGAPKETVPFAEETTYNQMDKLVREQHEQATQAHTSVNQ